MKRIIALVVCLLFTVVGFSQDNGGFFKRLRNHFVVYDTIYKTIIIEDEPVKIDPIRRDVFFQRNKSNIEDTEVSKIKDIADYLNKYPQAKVDIRGYADVQTGNAKINARLAQERADIVVKTLIDDYGISADRITYSSYGDTVQPFAENDLNRVSICIAEVK